MVHFVYALPLEYFTVLQRSEITSIVMSYWFIHLHINAFHFLFVGRFTHTSASAAEYKYNGKQHFCLLACLSRNRWIISRLCDISQEKNTITCSFCFETKAHWSCGYIPIFILFTIYILLGLTLIWLVKCVPSKSLVV